MTIIADRTNDLHQRCFVSVRLVVTILQLVAWCCHVRGARFTLQPVAQGAWVFVRPRSHLTNFDTRTMHLTNFQVESLYPTFTSVWLPASLGWLLDRKDYLP
jgi:hypothetical protein